MGVRLYFRKVGDGPPLVLMHGLYGASDNWLTIAGKLSENYTVYALDLRNHGHSPHHPDHSYRSMVEDLALFFGEHHLQPAVMMGHSMGGKVAMLFAADYPEKVKKLIVVDIAPKNYLLTGDDSHYFYHRNILLAMMEFNFSAVRSRRQVEERLTEKIDDERVIRFLLKNVKGDQATKTLSWRLNPKALYNNLEEIVEGVNPRWFDGRIPILAYPVIFIRGLNSSYIGEDDIPEIRKIYPEARIVEIPGAGHWLHAEQPGLFLGAVTSCC